MKINWKVRVRNKSFWLALIPAALLLVQTLAEVLGQSVDFGELGNRLRAFVNALFAVLTVLGVVNDPTTTGTGDSDAVLSCATPKQVEKAKWL